MTLRTDAPFRSGQRAGRGKEEATTLTGRIALLLVAGLSAASTAQAASPSNRAPVVVRVTGGGFNWGDAAIGAAGGSALTLLAGSVVLGTRRKPQADERD